MKKTTILLLLLLTQTVFPQTVFSQAKLSETQRIGIIPDIEAKPTIKGIQEGRDEVLERAILFIENGK